MSHYIAYWRSHLFRNWRCLLLFSQVRAAAASSPSQGSSQNRSFSSRCFSAPSPGERSVAQNGAAETFFPAYPCFVHLSDSPSSSCGCSCLFCHHLSANYLIRYSSIFPNYSRPDRHIFYLIRSYQAFIAGKTYRYFYDETIRACLHERPRSQACARTGTCDPRRQMSRHFAF